MKKIYYIFFESYGEWDAFFEPSGKLITYWHCNDAAWRDTHFSELLKYMGYETAAPSEWHLKRMEKTFVKELKRIGALDKEVVVVETETR